jgi:hypothetical protein
LDRVAFSAFTETITDLVNEQLEEAPTYMPPPHPLESIASSPVPLTTSIPEQHPFLDTSPFRPPLAYVDVYVDDFVKAAQGWFNCLHTRRATFHSIDSVFRPNDADDVLRKEPISVKKLQKGDDFWSTQKIILGWLIDTAANKTIALPPHRRDRVLVLLQSLVHRKRTSVKQWHQLLGELRSMSLAIPGSQKLVTCTGLIYYKLTSYFYPRGGGAIVRKGCAVRPCPSSNITETFFTDLSWNLI